MSLRARVVSGLVAVAAIGLLLAGGIIYAAERSFLDERADQQARSAITAVTPKLYNGAVPRLPGGPPARTPPPGSGPGPAGISLPLGTYGQLRTVAGRVLRHTTPGYTGQVALRAPKLPADLRAGDVLTVPATGDS